MVERREGGNHTGVNEVSQAIRLVTGINHRTQIIASRLTGGVYSREMLIDASSDDIVQLLKDPDISIQVFLSQLLEAFYSGEHRHINIEVADLKRPNFARMIHPILQLFRRRKDRKNIVIEITERGKVEDVYDLNFSKNIHFLKKEGFTLFIDDYDLYRLHIAGNVSRIILARFKGIIGGVKIPHEQSGNLLNFYRWSNTRALDDIPHSIQLVVEGMGLLERRNYFPGRVMGVQDPINR